MIFFMDLFKKKTEPGEEPKTPEDICKKFLKNVIIDETNIGTKKFRKELYNRLLEYGVWNNFIFCNELNILEFASKAGYKKQKDIDRLNEIRIAVRKKHFK